MDLNAILRSLGPPISSADQRASVASATAGANFEEVTIPGGAIGVYVSQEELTQPGLVVFLAAGASAPAKAGGGPDGTLSLAFDNHASTYYFPLDGSDPPSMFVSENGAATANFHFHFIIGTK